ncbi:MAG TPA: L-threonylcarbamoyladenylate synthase [Chloroflexota bacterium]|nr:L-threonylcarbamoyladenylate synthase [Chloroflexota bacterium]HUM71239.1 L-threonylcarbamoyladenylate synthase [Chloroflexota bacterium]
MESSEQQYAQHLYADRPADVAQTAVYVCAGKLVVIPTDTVYGVGCHALDEAAIRRLYQIKQRALYKAIPVLLADVSDLEKIALPVSPIVQRYITQYWPGALTIVLPKRPGLPPALSPDDTIAVRIPNHEAARAVIRRAGGAMAVTSANLSGQPPAETAEQAMSHLGGLVTAVLDDGPSPMGLASTVIDCTGTKPVVLRQGPVVIE